METIFFGFVVFACTLTGLVLGVTFRSRRPEHHFASESKDVVKLGAGLIGTMTALVLGLMVASAKNSYDSQKAATTNIFGDSVLLDRVLAHYGPETTQARKLLRDVSMLLTERLWSHESSLSNPTSSAAEALYDAVFALKPTNEVQRALQSQAQNLLTQIGRARLQLFEQSNDRVIPVAFLVVVISWLSAIFFIFGMLSPRNSTVAATLLVCALSTTTALCLVVELENPFNGIISISSSPARAAILQLGQ